MMPRGASHPDLQVGYYDLLRMTDERKADLGCVLLEVGGIEAFTRWAEARARHHPWGSRARPGFAPGTVEALRAAQSQLVLCTCGALVHLQSARAQARKAGRCFIVRGDGCGSSLCSSSHVQPSRFARRQLERATGLLDGTRTLVLPPPTVMARVGLWAAPPSLVMGVANSTLCSASSTPGRALRSSGGGGDSDELGAREMVVQPTLLALEASAEARISRMRTLKVQRRRVQRHTDVA